MTSLYAYRKFINDLYTRELRLPEPDNQGGQSGQELATLADGRTIVVLFDGYSLPAGQPAEIVDSIEVLTNLSGELKSEIRAASPHARLIAERMQERIRKRYSVEDEMKFSRIGVDHALGLHEMSTLKTQEMAGFRAYMNECLEWARVERVKLGLG